MRERRVGIIMNGVTGRMGLNQHFIRSILAMAQAAEKARVKHGVVQDKLFLPGMRKLRRLPCATCFPAWFTSSAC